MINKDVELIINQLSESIILYLKSESPDLDEIMNIMQERDNAIYAAFQQGEEGVKIDLFNLLTPLMAKEQEALQPYRDALIETRVTLGKINQLKHYNYN